MKEALETQITQHRDQHQKQASKFTTNSLIKIRKKYFKHYSPNIYIYIFKK